MDFWVERDGTHIDLFWDLSPVAEHHLWSLQGDTPPVLILWCLGST